MKLEDINQRLFSGEIGERGVFPHLDQLADRPFRFDIEFGLDKLPEEPGVLLVRGPRQYGKSTWLEHELRATIEKFGPATAFYVNGDFVQDAEALETELEELATLFRADAAVKRLFIDEITAVSGWEIVLKRTIDRGTLRDVLVVTTGSKASDLRRGSERLPGRKGRLARTTYLFTPISYAQFEDRCRESIDGDPVIAYMLAGGCPLACAEIATTGVIPEYVAEMIRDWVYGECAGSGRSRSSLVAVMKTLLQRGGTPVGQAQLARESGLANNTVAAGYVELLADLLCLGVSRAWDASRKVEVTRKRAKYPFINTLAASAWSENQPRAVGDFAALSEVEQGKWIEWLVAQELWRRRAIAGTEFPENLPYWQGEKHEIDFVGSSQEHIEVKRTTGDPRQFAWFPRSFPKGRLTVVGDKPFETDRIRGVTLAAFMRGADHE